MSAAAPSRPLTHYAMLSIAAAVLTFALKLAAWYFTGSVGLLSDALESLVNLVAAVFVGVALVALTGWDRLDPILGLLLAAQIVFTGVKLVRQSMMGLMDTALPNGEVEIIRAILARHAADGMQYHALRTRQAGAW